MKTVLSTLAVVFLVLILGAFGFGFYWMQLQIADLQSQVLSAQKYEAQNTKLLAREALLAREEQKRERTVEKVVVKIVEAMTSPDPSPAPSDQSFNSSRLGR